MKRVSIVLTLALVAMMTVQAWATESAFMGLGWDPVSQSQKMYTVVVGDAPFRATVTYTESNTGGFVGSPQLLTPGEPVAHLAEAVVNPNYPERLSVVPVGQENVITALVSIFDDNNNLLYTITRTDTLISVLDQETQQPSYAYRNAGCTSIWPDTIRIGTAFCAYVCHGAKMIPIFCENGGYDPSLLEVTVSNGCSNPATHCNNATCAQVDWSQFHWYKRVYEGCRLFLSITYCGTNDPGCVCIWRSDFYLPVQMNSFTATAGNHNVQLNWATASEQNTINFIVSRSETRDNDYVEVYRTEAAGNSSSTINYAWTDRNVENGKTYFYKLHVIDANGNHVYNVNGQTVVAEATPGTVVVSAYSLAQNYPNPFNSQTSFSFSIPASGHVTLKVFDLLGRDVATVVDRYMTANSYNVNWNADGLPTGVYMYKLTSGNFTQTMKLLYLK
jgi:hypothetical protein